MQALKPAPARRQRVPVGHSAFVVQRVISSRPQPDLQTACPTSWSRQQLSPGPQLTELEHESDGPMQLPFGVHRGGASSDSKQHSCVAVLQVVMPHAIGLPAGPLSTAMGPLSMPGVTSTETAESVVTTPVSVVVAASPASSSAKSSMVRAPQPARNNPRTRIEAERFMPWICPGFGIPSREMHSIGSIAGRF